MASAAQLEAFDWWLDQSREDRTASTLHLSRDVPLDTARRWVTAFNKRLAREVERSITVKLREYVDEYEAVQACAMKGAVSLSKVYASRTEEILEMTQNGEPLDIAEVCRIASGLRTAYQLAESASGADIAKREALRIAPYESKEYSGLPSLAEVYAQLEVDQ